MSSRSLAAARSRRAGEQAPPVSGNRPVTSIGSQAAFAGQQTHSSNVRIAKAPLGPQVNQYARPPPPQYQQFYEQPQSQQQQTQQQSVNPNGLPFTKLSISDAIGLITLRLGRVEQWIIDTDNEEQTKSRISGEVSDNHKLIDNSVLATIINRIDSLEKNTSTGATTQMSSELNEEVKSIKEQIKRMSDDVSKHTIELAKCTEQVFRFNRELTETKDILKSFMVKYDMFAHETTQNFSDYELALADLEKRLPTIDEEPNESDEQPGTSINDNDTENNSIIMTVDLKNMIKEELSNI